MPEPRQRELRGAGTAANRGRRLEHEHGLARAGEGRTRRRGRSAPSPRPPRRRSDRPNGRAACSCLSIIGASHPAPMGQWAGYAVLATRRRRPRAGAPPPASRRDCARAARPLLRHQPRPLLDRDRPPFRPPGEPLLEGPARLRLHAAALPSQRRRGAPRLRDRDHQPVLADDGQCRRAHRSELERGGRALVAKALRYRPRVVAILGIGAYRAGFSRPEASIGRQDVPTAGSLTWVLPNPSGLNAHYGLDDLVHHFRMLRAVVVAGSGRRRR